MKYIWVFSWGKGFVPYSAYSYITKNSKFEFGNEVYLNPDGFAIKNKIKDRFVGIYFKDGVGITREELIINERKMQVFIEKKKNKGYEFPVNKIYA